MLNALYHPILTAVLQLSNQVKVDNERGSQKHAKLLTMETRARVPQKRRLAAIQPPVQRRTTTEIMQHRTQRGNVQLNYPKHQKNL